MVYPSGCVLLFFDIFCFVSGQAVFDEFHDLFCDDIGLPAAFALAVPWYLGALTVFLDGVT